MCGRSALPEGLVILRSASGFIRLGTMAHKAPRGTLMLEALAASLPIVDVVDEFAARLVARQSQHESAIGTGDRLEGHCTRALG